MVDPAVLNEDFLDLLHSLIEHGVEFLVVGAHAMAAHGVPRATGDLDVFVRPSPPTRRVSSPLSSASALRSAHTA